MKNTSLSLFLCASPQAVIDYYNNILDDIFFPTNVSNLVVDIASRITFLKQSECQREKQSYHDIFLL